MFEDAVPVMLSLLKEGSQKTQISVRNVSTIYVHTPACFCGCSQRTDLLCFVIQVTPPVCTLLFDNCQIELREMELLTFLACIVVLKNRKQQSLKSYVSTVCAFTKALSAFLFLR